MSGGIGSEPGQALARHVHVPRDGPSATLPFDQLTLNDVQNYSQPFSFGSRRPTS